MTREEAVKILKSGEIVAINCDMKYYTEAMEICGCMEYVFKDCWPNPFAK